MRDVRWSQSVGPFVFDTDQPDRVTIRIHTTESEYVEAVLPVIVAPAFVEPLPEAEPEA